MKKYNAVVIGAGPAGQSCAVRIAELGGKVAVVERDFIGGICTNWGCTPSKAMIESAKVAHEVENSGKYGITVDQYQIDFSVIAKRRNKVIINTRDFITDLLQHHRVVHAHPTYNEIIKSALEYAEGKAVDFHL
ncbi:MAG: FAD-dependent oxidoreductase [Chloroflexota bacterium]|jgi:dihydrolipoamide dehydrogenase|nr:FAD-dependent oxidoreductase [Chloroflexota bacterium]